VEQKDDSYRGGHLLDGVGVGGEGGTTLPEALRAPEDHKIISGFCFFFGSGGFKRLQRLE
jgi:hypothetical protein